jgi:hypothetical protein
MNKVFSIKSGKIAGNLIIGGGEGLDRQISFLPRIEVVSFEKSCR